MKNKFVLGVVGSQNTGKSTFVKDLIARSNIPGTDILPFQTVGCDYRKKIEEAGLSINQGGTVRSQKIILDTLLEQIHIIDNMPEGNYVTDRTPIDNYVYSAWLYKHRPEAAFTSVDMTEIWCAMKKSIASYDAIVFMDLDRCRDIDIVADGLRDTDPKFREEIDQIFKDTFLTLGSEVLGGKVNCLLKGTRDQRVDQFLEYFGKFIAKKNEVDGE